VSGHLNINKSKKNYIFFVPPIYSYDRKINGWSLDNVMSEETSLAVGMAGKTNVLKKKRLLFHFDRGV
jgi:hypothetical protein